MELWTVEEAAAYLKLHPDTIRRKAREHEIPCVRIGGRWLRFQPEKVKQWVDQGCPSQEQQPSLFD